jgi:hypothetical protein
MKRIVLFPLLCIGAVASTYAATKEPKELILPSDVVRRKLMILAARNTPSTPNEIRELIFDLTELEQRSNVRLPALEKRKTYLVQQLAQRGINPHTFCYGVVDKDQNPVFNQTTYFQAFLERATKITQLFSKTAYDPAAHTAKKIHSLKERKATYILARQKVYTQAKIDALAQQEPTGQNIKKRAALQCKLDDITYQLKTRDMAPHAEQSDTDSDSDGGFEVVDRKDCL